jgi:hypothetical protein
MIDFRYHLVSIVAVFLALAIGIVLGSTELQGNTIDVLRSSSDSLKNQLNAVSAQRDSLQAADGASETFLKTAEPQLIGHLLAGDRVVIVAEPGASSGMISDVQQAAAVAGATVTGTVALQPKFNDLSGTTDSSLSAINNSLASTDNITLGPAADLPTLNQQQAAQLIADAILYRTPDEVGLTAPAATTLLAAYNQGGYLTATGAVTDRATLAVLVTPATAATAGASDPGNEVLLAVAQELAGESAATVVVGSVAGSSPSGSAMTVLRSSSVSSQVSSVDNADTTLGQISAIWALAYLLAGDKPNSYGISGASAVSPVPLPVPTPTVTVTSSAKATGKGTKSVKNK